MAYMTLQRLQLMGWLMTALAVGLTMGRFISQTRNPRGAIKVPDLLNASAAIVLVAFMAVFQTFIPAEYGAVVDAKSHNYPLVSQPSLVSEVDVQSHINPWFDLYMNFIVSFLFWVCIYTVKASFLALYYNVFAQHNPQFKRFWKMMVVYTGSSFLTTLAVLLFRCGGPEHVVDRAYCIKYSVHQSKWIMPVWCIVDGSSDLALAIMPWYPILKDQHMKKTAKAQLGLILMIVLANVATNVFRTVVTEKHNIAIDPHVNAVCTIMQITVAVIICALPPYGRHLTADMFRRVFRNVKNSLTLTHNASREKTRQMRENLRRRFPRKSATQGTDHGNNHNSSSGRAQASIPLQDLHPIDDGQARGSLPRQELRPVADEPVVDSGTVIRRDRAAADTLV